MLKRGLYILAFLLLLLYVTYSFFLKSGMDKIDESILRSDNIECSIGGINISFPIEKLKDDVNDFIEKNQFEEPINSDNVFKEYESIKWNNDNDSYLNILGNEINKHKSLQFNGSKYKSEKETQNFKYAKYYYDVYINGVQVFIYADSNRQITCLELKTSDNHYHEMYEKFVFFNNEIHTISRNYMVLKSVGFNGESRSYNTEQEIMKFAHNYLFEILLNDKGDITMEKDISEKQSKKYLKNALLFKKISQTIIESPRLNCVEKQAMFADGSDVSITAEFNNKFQIDSFYTINNEKYIYRELIGISINEKGIADTILINPFSGSGPLENKVFHNRVSDDISKIIKQMQWFPAVKNCNQKRTMKYINIVYNFIVANNKLDINSSNKGKFEVFQEKTY